MIKQFTVRRFSDNGNNATTLNDVKRFAEEHQGKPDLIVEIDPAGPGDGFAGHMEASGLIVRGVASSR